MKITNIHEAKTHLSRLLVKLIPYKETKQPRQPGGWEGKVIMSDDFNEELL